MLVWKMKYLNAVCGLMGQAQASVLMTIKCFWKCLGRHSWFHNFFTQDLKATPSFTAWLFLCGSRLTIESRKAKKVQSKHVKLKRASIYYMSERFRTLLRVKSSTMRKLLNSLDTHTIFLQLSVSTLKL